MVAERIANFKGLVQGREQFLMLVYVTLVAQLLLTYGVMESDRIRALSSVRMGVLISVLVGISLVVSFLPLPWPVLLVLFSIFSVTNIALTWKTWKVASEESRKYALWMAKMGAVVLFGVMTFVGAYVAASGVNLASWAPYLMAPALAFFALFLLVSNGVFKVPRGVSDVVAAMSLGLFTVRTVFNTNLLLLQGRDFSEAAFELYIDYTQIFNALLELLEPSLIP